MKDIIVYFSWSNNTKKLVEAINQKLKDDVVRIERKNPYSTDYNQCAYVEAKEEVDKRIHPEIQKLTVSFNQYDRILLFFPIWWYTFPMPIATFIEQLKGYQGKIVVFANSYTNDYQYMVNAMRDLKQIDGNLQFEEGLLNKSVKQHLQRIQKDKI